MDTNIKSKDRILNTSPYNRLSTINEFTACVGTNGNYGQDTICDGFKDAVHILTNSLESGEGTADSLVYPILFCIRHSIELYLKDIYHSVTSIYIAKTKKKDFIRLQKLNRIEKLISQRINDKQDKLSFIRVDSVDEDTIVRSLAILKKRQQIIEGQINEVHNRLFNKFNLNSFTHNLSDLKDIILNFYTIDKRISEVFDPVLPYLSHYEWIDPKGDVFRYLNDHKGEPHLKKNEISHIDILTAYFQYRKISEILENTQCFLYNLRMEYKTGTFTKSLSREQLKEISKLLPNPHIYNDSIKGVKILIQEKYKISSNEFDNALDIINKHREFSNNRGKEIIFSTLSKSTLEKFGECAIGVRDWQQASKDIKHSELCLLWVFSEISGWRYIDNYYSEDLNDLYRAAKHKHNITSYSINPKVELSYVINGMKKCGQKTYAEILNQYLYVHKSNGDEKLKGSFN